jgi:hypothetical protein
VSRLLDIGPHRVRLACTSPATYRVYGAPCGRILGSVWRERSRWYWSTTRSAYRGDGRAQSLTDGSPLDVVPEALDGLGKAATQQAACAALVAHLEARKAPALGYGPHPDVRSPSHV